jgi:hypothetical protein
MHISIWPQFSSNHSARFTVVGIFDTPTDAHRAASTLHQLARDIAAWRAQNEPSYTGDWNAPDPGDGPPSEPEVAFAQRHDVEWGDYTLDWLWLDEQGQGPFQAEGNLLYVGRAETFLGAHPIDYAVERLGGRALVDGAIDGGDAAELWGQISVNLTCTAPDDAIAAAIETAVNHYLRTSQHPSETIFNTPWKDYTSVSWKRSTFNGSVRSEGARLWFEHGTFFDISGGLPALLAYLRANGCTDIAYNLTEKRGFPGEDF